MQESRCVVTRKNVVFPVKKKLSRRFLQAAFCVATVVIMVGRITAQTPQATGLVRLTEKSWTWVATNNHSSKRALLVREEPNMIKKRLETEIVALHQFFEGWFTGRLANTDENYRRFSDVVSKDFEIISPEGTSRARTGMIDGLRQTHGNWSNTEKPGRIWIQNVRSRVVGERFYIATYEEWQQENGVARGRLSTALFRERADAPNGVEWLHVHETWLPEKQ